MAAARARLSLVQDSGQYASSCGYCGTRATHEDSSWSHGMMAEVLTAEAYQALIDRGWRRSGQWLYQPINERTCCQLLTIRLDVLKFRPNKEQRRAVRRWEEFLAGAPLGAQQPGHHPPAQQHQQAEQHGQQEQQRMLENPDGVQFPAAAPMALLAPGSGDGGSGSGEAAEVRGASPKRPHEDLEEDDWRLGEGPAAGVGAPRGASPADGSKRQRSMAGVAAGEGSGGQGGAAWSGAVASLALGGGGAAAVDPSAVEVAGASPTQRLASQMQHVLRSPLKQHEQPEQQQLAPHTESASAAGSAAAEPRPGQAVVDATALATSLAAALQRCVADGLLPGPAGAYPAPRVLEPSAKQRKVLPAGVLLCSPFALAVAAAARRAAVDAAGGEASAPAAAGPQQASGGASRGDAALSAEAVAELLAQRAELPAGVEVRPDRGHLNFFLPGDGGGSSGGSGGGSGSTAGGGAAASSGPSDAGAAAGAAQQRQQMQQQQRRRREQHPQQHPQQQHHQQPRAAGLGAVPRGVPRHFELTMVRSEPSLVALEFELYKKYQVVHHGDPPHEVTQRSFKRFLVDSPIRHAPTAEYGLGGAPPCGYGSFHQQYWLDGRLVAVGVVDVLPSCLSSVYLFWDPDLGPLSLGKLSAVKEIEWVQSASAACPTLHYYYLGFYIHNCHRMRYKGDYAPSDLLCPKSKCWVPLDRCRHALEQPGMVVLSELPGALEGLGEEHLVSPEGRPMVPPALPSAEEVEEARLFLQASPVARGQMVTLRALAAAGVLTPGVQATLRQRLAEWIRAVGPCWHAVLYHL